MNKYERVSKIGSGSFGSVWLVKHRDTQQEYALKQIQIKTADQVHKIQNEINILQLLES